MGGGGLPGRTKRRRVNVEMARGERKRIAHIFPATCFPGHSSELPPEGRPCAQENQNAKPAAATSSRAGPPPEGLPPSSSVFESRHPFRPGTISSALVAKALHPLGPRDGFPLTSSAPEEHFPLISPSLGDRFRSDSSYNDAESCPFSRPMSTR